MGRLRYFTRKAVESLRNNVQSQLDWYFSPNGRSYPRELSASWTLQSQVESRKLSGLLDVGESRPHASDAKNAMVVYQALSNLTPQQAVDERLWAHLSHGECAEYISARWLTSRPAEDEQAIRSVRNHFFARDARGVTRDHGVARLWWLGATAHDVHPYDPQLFLEIVLHRQDVRSALMERPSVSMNRYVLRNIFAVMREHWDGDRGLFKREVFRAWMANLNRRGGVVLLDALPEDPMIRLLRSEAKRALDVEAYG